MGLRRRWQGWMPLGLVALWGCQCSDVALRNQPGSVTALLCDPVHGNRVAGQLLVVDAKDGSHEAQSRDDGQVSVTGVPPGPVTVRIRHLVPGLSQPREDFVQEDTLVESGEIHVVDPACIDPPLSPGRGGIQGQVCNRHTGDLVRAAEVSALSARGETASATTSAGGYFLLTDVPAGDWVVTIRAQGYQRSFNAHVEAGSVTVLPIGAHCTHFDPNGTGSVGGQLCIDNGSGPWSGAVVTVLLADGTVFQDVTDVHGEFLLEGLPPGEHDVTIRGGGEQVTYRVTVSAGQTTPVAPAEDCPVPDRQATGDIRGQLCDPDQGGWLVGALAETVQGARTFRDHTDERGRFHLAGLAPGDVTVTITRGSYQRVFNVPVVAQTTVTVADGVCAPPTWQCHDVTKTVDDTAPLRILLLVDKSGSMQEDGLDGQKWSSQVTAIKRVTTELASTAAFGLALFPSGSASTAQCEAGRVVVVPAVDNARSIGNALDNASPGGGTPTGVSVQAVHQWLMANPSTAKSLVILATDGVPNCNAFLDGASCACPVQLCPGSAVSCCQTDPRECCLLSATQCLDDGATLNAIRSMAASGIPTYVVGLPGSEDPSDVLTRMAQAGGTTAGNGQSYYRPNSAQQLADDVTNIVTTNRSCRFELDAAPNDPQLMEVRVNGATVPRDAGRRQGWDLVGDQGLELYGTACETLRAGGSATLLIHYCTDA